jgi:hypothetical protein
LKATRPVSFFVYVQVSEYDRSHWQDGCWDNAHTNERLVIKTVHPPPWNMFNYADDFGRKVQISRYPIGSTKEWIEANEKEIKEWKFDEQNRQILFERKLGK